MQSTNFPKKTTTIIASFNGKIIFSKQHIVHGNIISRITDILPEQVGVGNTDSKHGFPINLLQEIQSGFGDGILREIPVLDDSRGNVRDCVVVATRTEEATEVLAVLVTSESI